MVIEDDDLKTVNLKVNYRRITDILLETRFKDSLPGVLTFEVVRQILTELLETVFSLVSEPYEEEEELLDCLFEGLFEEGKYCEKCVIKDVKVGENVGVTVVKGDTVILFPLVYVTLTTGV